MMMTRATSVLTAAILSLVAALLLAAPPGAEAGRVKVRPVKFEIKLSGLTYRQFRSPQLRREFCRAYTSVCGVDVKVCDSK